MTLLLALGVVTFLTLGAITTLNLITAQTDPAGQDRRAKEAFFAAEAGLAEAREWLRLQTAAIPSPQPTNAILAELAPAADLGGAGYSWYQVPLGSTPASWVSSQLSQRPDTNGAQALDPNVSTAGLELTSWDGTQYQTYPDSARLVYRVFLRDDDDGDGDPTVDSNGTVWLVAVGQVQVGLGVPVQSVVRVWCGPEPARWAPATATPTIFGTLFTSTRTLPSTPTRPLVSREPEPCCAPPSSLLCCPSPRSPPTPSWVRRFSAACTRCHAATQVAAGQKDPHADRSNARPGAGPDLTEALLEKGWDPVRAWIENPGRSRHDTACDTRQLPPSSSTI